MVKLSDTSKIKEIINLLNEYFPSDGHIKKFLAYFPKENDFQGWHICCTEFFLIHSDKEFDEIKDMIRERYKVKMVFCYLHEISVRIMIKNKTKIFIK